MFRRLFCHLCKGQQQHVRVQGQVNRTSARHNSGTISEAKPRSRVRLLLLSVGTGGVVYLGYRVLRKPDEESQPRLAKNWQVTLYRKMPLKAMSRAWGKMTETYLPVVLREPLLGLYVWMFSVNLGEAHVDNLRSYENLSEFFRRQLKPNARIVDPQAPLTSPADGRILHHGKVENGVVEQVKGVNYDIKAFLGPTPTPGSPDVGGASGGGDAVGGALGGGDAVSDADFQVGLHIKPGHSLYHCIIYLAPGDYHRFHSPTDWKVAHRRHFPGELMSVNPGVARWVQGLFSLNERVVYSGTWKYGYFSYTAVGATNVGSIRFYMDEYLLPLEPNILVFATNVNPYQTELRTNISGKYPESTYFDKTFSDQDSNNNTLISKGDMLGEFNLGSTIVLIFEAPDNFNFSVEPGRKVKYGESLGYTSS